MIIGPEIWGMDERSKHKLGRVFAGLTRMGLAPHYDSRPIGYYQQEQCAAIDELTEHAVRAGVITEPRSESFAVRTRGGIVEARSARTARGTLWRRLDASFMLKRAIQARIRRQYG